MTAPEDNRNRIRANIVSWDGGGLGTDIDLLMEILPRAGCAVSFKGRRNRWPCNRVTSLAMTAGVVVTHKWATITGRPVFDVNFFIESVFPEYLPSARVNCLFVHPEWFREENIPHLPRLDLVLCKTPSAVDAFRELAVTCRLVGFTSPDRRIPNFPRSGPLRCLHLSGQSALKGTEAVVEAWSRHPDWPELTVVRRARRYSGEAAPPLPVLSNVRYETGFVPDDTLRELQNAADVHVIPSQAEGYGHVIGEAMSCGAVVVTTDAPPMNELVERDRGVLVKVARSEPMRRSTRNFIDIADLEAKLHEVFRMPAESRARMGVNARAWYEAQHTRFESALVALLTEVPRMPGRRGIPAS